MGDGQQRSTVDGMAVLQRGPTEERLQLGREVTRLRGEGLTGKHIAARLGIPFTTVRVLMSDPDGSKARTRKDSYGGQCIECGGPTNGSNGRDQAGVRCTYCVRGIRRENAPDKRRCVPVRLTEIPLERRVEAAKEAIRRERDELDKIELIVAAQYPSSTVYWVAA